MVMTAREELRHTPTRDPAWRESLWFCFQDPVRRFGSSIGFSYLPNDPNPRATFRVALCQGMERRPNQPRYLFMRELPIPDDDFDDLSVDDVASIRCLEPLRRWQLRFDDGERMAFELEADFYAGGWHYIDNLHPTPKYLAADRYHRPWAVTGQIRLDGEVMDIDTTGDSDHSWGPRHWEPLYKSKYIAAQCGRDFAFQLVQANSADGGTYPYGFVWDGTAMSPITGVEVASQYAPDGIQETALINIVDGERRLTRVQATSFAAYPTEAVRAPGAPVSGRDVRNNDTYATFEINDGEHVGSGILSYYWNREYYAAVLAGARAEVTP
jgi:hypothetical protein